MVELFNALPEDAQERSGSETTRELLSLFRDDVEFVQQPNLVGMHDAHGRQGLESTWMEWLGLWKSQRSEITELHEREGQVLVFSHDRFEARDGMKVEMRGSVIYTVADGQITQMQVFGEDHDAARAEFERGEADEIEAG